MKRIRTLSFDFPLRPSSEKITAGDKELEVVEKIVTTRRVCETNYLRVIINIKYVVR